MTNCELVSPAQSSGPMASKSMFARALDRSIRAYQVARSGRHSPCRFHPSCSNYALEALEVHGVWRGLLLTARRVLRCRPFGPHGIDLVPLSQKARKTQ